MTPRVVNGNPESGSSNWGVFLVEGKEVDLENDEAIAEVPLQEGLLSRGIHISDERNERRVCDFEDGKEKAVLYDRGMGTGRIRWVGHVQEGLNEVDG
jgi:hypothetical protein